MLDLTTQCSWLCTGYLSDLSSMLWARREIGTHRIYRMLVSSCQFPEKPGLIQCHSNIFPNYCMHNVFVFVFFLVTCLVCSPPLGGRLQLIPGIIIGLPSSHYQHSPHNIPSLLFSYYVKNTISIISHFSEERRQKSGKRRRIGGAFPWFGIPGDFQTQIWWASIK